MVLRVADIDVSQQAIVTANYGSPVNKGAFSLDQLAATISLINAATRNAVQVTTDVRPEALTNIEVIDFIDKGRPIIAAIGDGFSATLPSHVVVVYGYQMAPGDKLWLHYYDPWPGKGFRQIPFSSAFDWEQTLVMTISGIDVDDELGDEDECLAMDDVDIDWNPSATARVVRYEFVYENTCDDTHTFSIEVQSGYAPRDADHDDYSDWTVHDSRKHTLRLNAGATRSIRGRLKWFRTADTEPRLREIVKRRS
jgi:hypothetical protein